MRKLLLSCRCVGSCTAIGIDDWEDRDTDPDMPWNWTFEFYSRTGGGPGSLRFRVKQAWAILQGKEHYFDCVCLDGTDVRKLRDFLNEGLGDA